METKPKRTTAKRDSKKTFKVGNFEVELGKTYEVVGKIDYDAPDAFKLHKTTKYLIPGIGEERGISFDDSRNLWDTGFYVDSEVNNKIPKDIREEQVKNVNEWIKEPFEKRYNVSLGNTVQNTFWDSYTYSLYKGRVFDTTNPKDLLDLYLALQNGRICAENEKNATLKNDAKYCVRNREREITVLEERAETKMEAYAAFSTLLGRDLKEDDTLFCILEWLNIPDIRNSDKDAIKKVVLRYFEDTRSGYEFAERFLKAFEETKTDVGTKKFQFFSMAQALIRARVIELKRREYFLNGDRLGASVKEIAESCVTNPEKAKKLDDAYADLIND